MKIMNPELERKMHVAQELQQKNLPMLQVRQSAFIIYGFFKINEVQGRLFRMNHLRYIELTNDSLMLCDQTWEEPCGT